jgi:membrane-bound lytic murein transglycosylase D
MPRVTSALLAISLWIAGPGRAESLAPSESASDAGAVASSSVDAGSAAAAPPAVVPEATAMAPSPAQATAPSPAQATAPSPAQAAAPQSPAKAAPEEVSPAASAQIRDAPDDPSLAPKLEAAAQEMADERAAEAAALEPGVERAEEVFRLMRRAGPASPLHRRLNDALGSERALPMVPNEGEMEAAALAEIGSFDIEKAKKLYDIPVELTPQVAEAIRFFQTWGRKHFVRWLGRSSRYLPMMRRTLREQGLPEDTIFLSMIESGFSPLAYSWAKASGLWQFIEPTGRRFGLQVDFWVDQRRDPARATVAATGYLKELYAEFGDWRLAWAGYDSGAGTVRRAIRVAQSTDFWELARGRVFRKETKYYVPKLMAAALITKHLKHFGFSEQEIEAQAALEYEEVEVPEATDLEVIARAAGIGLEELKELNPELRRWCTPPSRNASDVYKIKLPPGTAQKFAEGFAQIAPKDRLSFRVHRVGKGDTLSQIAGAYGSAVEAIMRINGMRDSRRLKLGAELVVPVPRSGSREAMALQARRSGFRAAPASEEVPAAAPPPRSARLAAAGSQRSVKEGNRTKVIYGVAEGDSLWSIARHFDVHVQELRAWNDFGNRKHLKIGQEIVVYPGKKAVLALAAEANAKTPERSPPAPSGAALGTRQVTHMIAPGDTLSSLAHRYKVTIEDLKRWNNLSTAKLRVGRPLTVMVPGA